MITKIKSHALAFALGALLVIGLNSLGYVVQVNVLPPLSLPMEKVK